MRLLGRPQLLGGEETDADDYGEEEQLFNHAYTVAGGKRPCYHVLT